MYREVVQTIKYISVICLNLNDTKTNEETRDPKGEETQIKLKLEDI